jgi:hypothetical protein
MMGGFGSSRGTCLFFPWFSCILADGNLFSLFVVVVVIVGPNHLLAARCLTYLPYAPLLALASATFLCT